MNEAVGSVGYSIMVYVGVHMCTIAINMREKDKCNLFFLWNSNCSCCCLSREYCYRYMLHLLKRSTEGRGLW